MEFAITAIAAALAVVIVAAVAVTEK